MGAEAVSDSVACLWDPFPATGSPHPALVWWYVPRIIVAYYGMFGGQCPCEACPFMRGYGMGARGGEGEAGGRGWRGNCGQVAIYMRTKDKRKNIATEHKVRERQYH